MFLDVDEQIWKKTKFCEQIHLSLEISMVYNINRKNNVHILTVKEKGADTMLCIVIVEDNKECARLLIDYIEQYEKESQEHFQVRFFSNGYNFLDEYKADYDIIFMDIEMPGINGMETAKKLRKIDENVCLIFVTNMAQYAASGYEVNALDFMVKPVGYFDFTLKLQRAIQYRKKTKKAEVVIKTENGLKRVVISDIYYVEVADHILSYHTADGIVCERGTIKSKEEQFVKFDFVRCNSCYLVNLSHVTEMTAKSIFVGGRELTVSRSKRKQFFNILTEYMGDYVK